MADYRDDREALRDRVERLERELGATRNEIAAKDAALAHRAAEVDRLRRLAGERTPGSAARSAALVVALLGAVLVLGGVGAAVFLRGAAAPAPAPAARPPMVFVPVPAPSLVEVVEPSATAPARSPSAPRPGDGEVVF